MIARSTDIHSALRSRQRGFFTMPGGMGIGRPSGGSSGGETESAWDAASKGLYTTIAGKTAEVWNNPSGYVRSDQARSTGRRVFGLRQTANGSHGQNEFWAGFATLSGWAGSLATGKNWISYAYDDSFVAYTTGSISSVITPSGNPGAPQIAGDTAYFDIDFSAGTARIKKNSSSWSSSTALTNFTTGDALIVTARAAAGSPVIGYELLTTPTELAGHIPSGAAAWDDI